MPVMDGIDATRNIRAIFKDKKKVPKITIIGVTGHVQSQY
jgi:CheY-like chemotaxis protein